MSSFASVTPRTDSQESLMLDLNTLDSDLVYRWVFNDPRQIAKRSSKGYRLVSRKTDGVKTLTELEEPPDDFIYNGDSVLMCCNREEYEQRREDAVRVARDRLSYPTAEFKRRHRESGARHSRVLDEDEEEVFT